MSVLDVQDLGRMEYARALALQRTLHAQVVARAPGAPWPLLLVEHDPPVITVSRRAGAGDHLVASQAELDRRGVQVCQTDRGGDITWHGPGQLVAYPIVDLRSLGLGIHAYIRGLEEAIIQTCAQWGVACRRDPGNTGVWCGGELGVRPSAVGPPRKIAAIGVRVSRWVTMHGLALNVDPDLTHFDLIVPCGIRDRAVTSLARECGARAPTMDQAKRALSGALEKVLDDALRAAKAPHAAAATRPSS